MYDGVPKRENRMSSSLFYQIVKIVLMQFTN